MIVDVWYHAKIRSDAVRVENKQRWQNATGAPNAPNRRPR